MKSEIVEIPPKEVFKPYQLVITIETIEEERVAAELFNHYVSIADTIHNYKPSSIRDFHRNTLSDPSIIVSFLAAFRDIYRKVYK